AAGLMMCPGGCFYPAGTSDGKTLFGYRWNPGLPPFTLFQVALPSHQSTDLGSIDSAGTKQIWTFACSTNGNTVIFTPIVDTNGNAFCLWTKTGGFQNIPLAGYKYITPYAVSPSGKFISGFASNQGYDMGPGYSF